MGCQDGWLSFERLPTGIVPRGKGSLTVSNGLVTGTLPATFGNLRQHGELVRASVCFAFVRTRALV